MNTLEYYMGLPYKTEMVRDTQDGSFLLYCPELKGCMTCADTAEAGIKLLEDAKREYFAACIEDGIDIPEPLATDDYSGQVNLPRLKSRASNIPQISVVALTLTC